MQLVPIPADGSVPIDAVDRPGPVPAVTEQMVGLYVRRGFVPPWIGYLAVEQDKCVGTCAFTGPPANGEVEIAYYTFPGHEGSGVATRMAEALLALGRAAAAERRTVFIAHTLPQEGASTSILRRQGFVLEGAIDHPEDGTVWKWSRVP